MVQVARLTNGSQQSLRLLVLLSCGIVASCDSRLPPPPTAAVTDTSKSPHKLEDRPPPDKRTEVMEVPETGINLGWGWNSVTNEAVPSVCVEFVEGREPAQTRSMSMHEVSDNYDLMQRMGMSAEASVKAIGLETSGKASFAKDTHISRFSSNFVMNATVENGVRYTAPSRAGSGDGAASAVPAGEVRLTAGALELAKRRDPAEFIHRCGHGYVSAVHSGAKLTAVITVDTNSREEHQRVSAELSGSGWGAKFKGNMEGATNAATSGKDLRVSIFQTGGRGDGIPVTKEDVLEKLDRLSAIAFDAPKDFHMAISSYETLANWPARSIEVDSNEYEQVGNLWGAYNALYDDIQQVLTDPTPFVTAAMDPASDCSTLSPLTRAANQSVTTVKMAQVALGQDHKVNLAQVTTAAGTVISPDRRELARLQRMQDDVLDTLHRLRAFAQQCASPEQPCNFPENSFRSPYAYRVQMPVEVGDTPQQMSAEDVLQTHVARPAKQRCMAASDQPGCLSNAEIQEWRERLGMEAITYPDTEARDAVVQRLEALQLKGAPAGCGDPPGPAISVEADHPVLWFHPRVSACVHDVNATAAQCGG